MLLIFFVYFFFVLFFVLLGKSKGRPNELVKSGIILVVLTTSSFIKSVEGKKQKITNYQGFNKAKDIYLIGEKKEEKDI